ncbi:MAG TPA: tetratricopeptide repeat protein [Steroidobacteraceae bacterium]|nr:tetratricopeptide repeat protein [Steroidobacteraceae bacterium]
MAEGLLGGVLGDEEHKPEVEAPEALASAEAFAAAVAAKLSGNDPGVCRKTEEFLSEQTQLLKVQREHLKDEHEARLHYLRGQAREVDIRRFGLRLRIGFHLFVALVATAIGIGAAVMIRDAVTSRRVVIDPFDIAPNVPAQVPGGKIVAGALLDELSRLQDATRSDVQRLDLSNAWASQVKLEVPETGVSLGELSRLLRVRFGHDVHIEGDLIETPAAGLALTVRGSGIPPKTFSGSATELEKLTTQAAEYVYSKSQPVRWAYYLQNAGRRGEAIAFCRAALGSASKDDRPYLLNVWANSIDSTGGSAREALALYRTALKLKPDYWIAHNNVMNSLWLAGDEEGAWRAGEVMRKAAGGRPGRARDLYYQNWDTLTWNLGPLLASNVADAEANAGVGTSFTTVGPSIADIHARLHDPEAAELALKTTLENPRDPTIGALTHFVLGRLAAEAGDAGTAATEMEAFGAAFPEPAVVTNYPGYNCWIAPAEEAAGHPDRADAVLKTAGTFVDCYRFRADILDGRGDWVRAQKAYADAVALAPDLPAAYYSWGVALMKHTDLDGAAAKLADANQKGPHWADPLKAWGDVLAKRGHAKEALVKYDEALKYAPNWAALTEARAAAAKRKT